VDSQALEGLCVERGVLAQRIEPRVVHPQRAATVMALRAGVLSHGGVDLSYMSIDQRARCRAVIFIWEICENDFHERIWIGGKHPRAGRHLKRIGPKGLIVQLVGPRNEMAVNCLSYSSCSICPND
jgi:hypothetical protein